MIADTRPLPILPRETAFTLVPVQQFVRRLKVMDLHLRRTGTVIPEKGDIQSLCDGFREMLVSLNRAKSRLTDSEGKALAAEVRSLLGPWLWRSRLWGDSFIKPYGYAGDFRIIEQIYDLESAHGQKPDNPPMVNCLDAVFSTVDAVQSVWERRHWIRDSLLEKHRQGGRMRILDIASGGARYVLDVLQALPSDAPVQATLLDRDPSAIGFCRNRFAGWGEKVRSAIFPAAGLGDLEAEEPFDVVVAAGLFDYLEGRTALDVIRQMRRLCAEDGLILLTNFHPSDRTRMVQDWLVDWPLCYKTEEEVQALFEGLGPVRTRLSRNGSLVMASGR